VKKVSHVGIEYAILLPILILQIIVLPFAASWMMSVWTNDRMKGEIQEAANQVSSAIKQLYLALKSPDVVLTSSWVNQTFNLPTTIESHLYYAAGPPSGVIKVLGLHFTLQGTGITTNSSAIFGSSVYWQSSTFFSNSSSACIMARWSSSYGMIWLEFG
jgi:uncharacterized MnhB-related membrane protein